MHIYTFTVALHINILIISNFASFFLSLLHLQNQRIFSTSSSSSSSDIHIPQIQNQKSTTKIKNQQQNQTQTPQNQTHHTRTHQQRQREWIGACGSASDHDGEKSFIWEWRESHEWRERV